MNRPAFQVVVSAENNAYQAWQAMLLHHSCLVHLGGPAVVVVHGDEPELVEPYPRLLRHGGIVQRVPNYRLWDGVEYAARNTPASLLHARTDAEYVILCDPDMVLTRSWRPGRYRMGARRVSVDRVSYLEIDDAARPGLEAACARAGIAFERLAGSPVRGGVPHIIPAGLRESLAREWLACIAAFHPGATVTDEPGVHGLDWHTNASMWGLLMAAIRLDVEPVLTRLCRHNHEGHLPCRAPGRRHGPWLHYCYANPGFDKRSFDGDLSGPGSVWTPRRAAPGSANAALFEAIRAAAGFYGIGGSDRPDCVDDPM